MARLRLPVALHLLLGACSSSGSSAEPPSNAAAEKAPDKSTDAEAKTPTDVKAVAEAPPTADEPSEACEGHRAALTAEYCDPDDQEEPCDVADLPCDHTLDFDGDGVPERVTLVRSGEALVLRVTMGSGGTQLVGATPTATTLYKEPGDVGRTRPPDWSWMMSWSTARREGDRMVHRRGFDQFPGLGDGLWVSGGDAAAILVLTTDGWLVVELGY